MNEKAENPFKRSWDWATFIAEDIRRYVHAPHGDITKFPSPSLIEAIVKLHGIRTFGEIEHLRQALQGFSDAQIIEYLNKKGKS